MKSKISKILGVMVTVTILASLLVGLTAVPAEAANLMIFKPVQTPSNMNNFLGGVTYFPAPAGPFSTTSKIIGNPQINAVLASPDGKTVYAWDNTNKALYMSTDSGVTFPNSVGINVATASPFVGMAMSPKFATDGALVIANTTEAWMVTGGLTNVVNVAPGDLSGVGGKLEGGTVSAVDLGYYFSDNTLSILVGATGGAGLIGNVLKFKMGGFSWDEVGTEVAAKRLITGGAAGAGLDAAVVAARFSVNHQSDAEIMAVYTDGTDTWLSSVVGTLGWDNAILPRVKINVVATPGIATGAIIATGTDYVGNVGSAIIIGTRGLGAADGIYRVTSRTAAAGIVSNPPILVTALPVHSIAISGPIATANVSVGLRGQATAQVFNTTGITGSTITWTNPGAFKAPSGSGAGLVSVQLQYAGSTLYAATTGTDGAVHSSANAGTSFDGIGLIDVGGLGASATITTVGVGGAITGISAIANGGQGYALSGTGGLNVTVLGGGQGAAWLSAEITVAAGAVTALAVPATPGTGYVVGQTIMLTNPGAANFSGGHSVIGGSGGHNAGLYKTADSGKTWKRIVCLPTIAGRNASPAYSTDKTYLVRQGSSSTPNAIGLITTDDGVTFTLVGAPVGIGQTVMTGGTGFYFSGPATGGSSTFYLMGRFTNATFTPAVNSTINSISRSAKDTAGLTFAVGMQNGTVYQSTDGGVTFTQVGTGPGAAADRISVSYLPDGTLLAAPTSAGTGVPPATSGIYKWLPATSSWLDLSTGFSDAAKTVPHASIFAAGFSVSTDGTMYATDYTTGNGIWRSLDYGLVDAGGAAKATWQQINNVNFPGWTGNLATIGQTYNGFPGGAGSKVSVSVASAATGNTLTITDSSTAIANGGLPRVMYTWVDSFIVGPGSAAPADKELLTTNNSVTLNWKAMDGPGGGVAPAGTNYAVAVTTSKDFTGATTPLVALDVYTAGSLTQTIGVNPKAAILTGGTLYNWQVQAISPIMSRPLVKAFTTALDPIAPGALLNPAPALGATDVEIDTTFSWPSVTGAKGYEFVIAEDLGNVDKFAIIDYSATTPTNAHKLRQELKYNTSYWWRIRAFNDTTKGDWSTFFFTTSKAPVIPTQAVITAGTPGPTQAPITITQTNLPQPTIIVTQPAPPAPVTPIPPYLLWAVIAVGAVLVIAVIVLIVRTRRMS